MPARKVTTWLVVEDNTDWFEDIRDAAVAGGLTTSEAIYRATSVVEYAQRQRERIYDVVVIDMRLRAVEDEQGRGILDIAGGKRVSPRARFWNRDQVVVLFSAYLEIEDVVYAMRHGAWDCIQKTSVEPNQGSVAKLMRSIKEWLAEERGEDAWFARELVRLVRERPGKLIAVADGEILAEDTSADAVRDKVRQQDPMKEFDVFLVPHKVPAGMSSDGEGGA